MQWDLCNTSALPLCTGASDTGRAMYVHIQIYTSAGVKFNVHYECSILAPNAKMNEARHESFSSDRMLHKESDGVRHSPAQRKKLDSFGPGLNLVSDL